ncbi:fatty acid/sphingolipid desaturase [Coniochaeta ligniaria NRRL 30616]|uniref:Delta 8-(E)-sphingolipid desaturase n=1 Tax=Coniochaeta ligniaria NRRL 30616 TaxID=1408157 RepID=A0A1J7JL13_9PEZI|nr:fatty acid/sphingolipid desaturase [Coniochaeta ligniaria NRRL 30616]
MDRDSILEPRAVEGMIAEGHVIVVFEDFVLNLDSWLHKHPGGRLAILHMVGRDATDEIKAYHSDAALKTMSAYRIGRKHAGPWTNMTPPTRGGVFYKQAASSVASEIDSDTELDDGSSLASSECSCADQFTDERVESHAGLDAELYPSVCPVVQQEIVRKYRILHQKVRDAGLYNCPYLDYGKEMLRYSALFAAFLVALRYEQYIISAMFLGLFWHQIMFTAHDAGHLAITSYFAVDTLIAMFVADFCCGLSIGWWKSSHNVHHLVTNSPEHDPDIQNVPLFATCPSFFRGIHSTYYDFTFAWDAVAEFMVPYQRYTYYPIMGIARFNLYLLSWLHVLSSKSSSLGSSKAWWIRPTEIAFMCCYWFLFGYCLVWRTLPTWTTRVVFVLVSHIITMPLHVQITLSHWGMSTAELGESESFPQRQLRTTMDVDCPAWLDFIHGGLQFQAVHHLFPRVPRHNLRKAQVLTRQFCEETGIPYSILNFVDGNRKVLDRLQEVGDQVKILLSCQKYMAETGGSGLH